MTEKLPKTVTGWVQLTLGILSVIVIIGGIGLSYASAQTEIKNLSGDVNELESHVEQNQKVINELQQDILRQQTEAIRDLGRQGREIESINGDVKLILRLLGNIENDLENRY